VYVRRIENESFEIFDLLALVRLCYTYEYIISIEYKHNNNINCVRVFYDYFGILDTFELSTQLYMNIFSIYLLPHTHTRARKYAQYDPVAIAFGIVFTMTL
jgi:hypothetical protein